MTRIIAGVARGRRLRTPAGASTRPTTDIAREALFASLGPMTGRTFLDLYAGSGAVGLEALSRGADAVTLVESNAAAVGTIRANVAALGLPGVTVVATSVERFLAASTDPFDDVFLDPPWAFEVAAVLAAALPRIGDRVVVERSARDPEPEWPGEVSLRKSRRYGETRLWYGSRP